MSLVDFDRDICTNEVSWCGASTKVFTVGFTKKSTGEFFAKLRRPGPARVVDVRLNDVRLNDARLNDVSDEQCFAVGRLLEAGWPPVFCEPCFPSQWGEVEIEHIL